MRLLLATGTLLIGAALAGGAYWTFLTTPESTVFTLAASAALMLVTLAAAALTINLAIEVCGSGLSSAAIRRAARAVPSALPAALVLLLLSWISSGMEDWFTMRSGQISALFIARLGWSDVSWLFHGIHYVAIWLRWVLAALLATSLMAGVLASGWPSLRQPSWIRRALRPRAIIIATAAFALFVAVPWMYLVPWRPRGIPATSAELAFIGAKLAVAAILFAVGAAIIIREASRMPPATPTAP